MIITKHKYSNDVKVKTTDTSLILGTIHPHRTEDFKIDFFYGNRNSIWTILSTAFPQYNFITKDSITKTLSDNNIWISDIINECERDDESVTQDKELKNIILNDSQIEEGILNSQIDTIFFTSGFGKNNAAKLFCERFKIKPDRNKNREFIISKDIFGREIRGVILFSPSGQANIGISKNELFLEQFDNYNVFKNPVTRFKIDFYKNAFINHLGNKT